MKKRIYATLLIGLFTLTLQAQNASSNGQNNRPVQANTSKDSNQEKTRLKIEVMQEDQIDGTDIFAIPYDDSNVEDEQILDRSEGKPYRPEVPTNNRGNVGTGSSQRSGQPVNSNHPVNGNQR
jgi:hypothetical protein